MTRACADRKRFAIVCDFVEVGNLIDVDQMRRLGEAKCHDRNKALATSQHAPILRCNLGQDPYRLVERFRHMTDERRGFHTGDSGDRANYLYKNDKLRLRIVKRVYRRCTLQPARAECPFVENALFLSYLPDIGAP